MKRQQLQRLQQKELEARQRLQWQWALPNGITLFMETNQCQPMGALKMRVGTLIIILEAPAVGTRQRG